MYQVAVESDEVVVRFRRDLVDREAVVRFFDYLELEAIRKRSQLTQDEANTLADDVDRDGWARLMAEWNAPEEDKAWSHLAQLPSLS